VLSSAGRCSGALLGRLLEAPPTGAELIEQAARVVAKAEPIRAAALAERAAAMVAEPDVRFALCVGLARVAPGTEIAEAAAVRAADQAAPVSSRVRAIRVLGLVGGRTAALLPLVDTREPNDVQIAAIRALGGGTAVLLTHERWTSCSAAAQEAILSETLAHRESVPELLRALEEGSVPAPALTSARRDALVKLADPALADRARKLFASAGGEDRMKVFEQWKQKVLPLTGDSARGRLVFATRCATCHRLDQQGIAVGPDLFDIRNQPRETILLHLIVPDREIYAGFGAYTINTKDGRTLSGLIASESLTAITLKMPAGIQETLLRSEIASLQASEHSMMPNGLEETMTANELADLLAHLRGE
jgi:putative heme-binding domain-containing protein